MAFFERFQRGHDGLRRLGTIDAAKRLGDWLAVLPGRKAHALSDQMHSLDTQWRGMAPTGHGRRAGSGSTRRSAARSSVPQCRRERSEEHTSELQSLMRISYAVFCLKKKKTKKHKTK